MRWPPCFGKADASHSAALSASPCSGSGTPRQAVRTQTHEIVERSRPRAGRVARDPCARPDVSCRNIYSMGVRQAVWRQKLWAEPDMRIVSAGIPDYLTAARQALSLP